MLKLNIFVALQLNFIHLSLPNYLQNHSKLELVIPAHVMHNKSIPWNEREFGALLRFGLEVRLNYDY